MKKIRWVATFLVLSILVTGLCVVSVQAQRPYAGQKIRCMFMKRPSLDALDPLIGEFEKQTGIKVEIMYLPEAEIYAKSELVMSSPDYNYDIVHMLQNFGLRYYRAGWIVPFDNFINDPKLTDKEKFNLDDFMPKYIAGGMADGKLASIPEFGESSMMYFNKEIYAVAGLPGPADNYDELVEYCQTLKSAGYNGIVLRGAGDAGTTYIWSGFFYSYGGEWFDQNWKPQLDTPAGIGSSELYIRLLKDYGPRGVASYVWRDALLSFQQARAATIIDSTNFMANFEDPDESVVVGKVGYALVPKGPLGKRVPSIGCWGFFIPQTAKHKEAAWEFLKWATSTETQIKQAWSKTGQKGDPTRRSVIRHPKFKERYPFGKWTEILEKSIDLGKSDYIPIVPELFAFWDKPGRQISAGIAGEVDAATAMKNTQEDVYKVMKEAGYYD